ncbi:MAG: DUF418 domain-containing protein [Tannerellaceae bacterium]|jgi:uncharacterized protein|nr:DUF418 domain-containing protein [Tannerellaceae bacterium]
MKNNTAPVTAKRRFVILDFLRGIALLGIGLANFPEFALYTFQKSEVVEAMPTAGIDYVVKFLQYTFIDGKFYTLFSLLFGIGFSIIISKTPEKGDKGLALFYRRMIFLFLAGLFHLLFLWAGDILVLYASLGLLLPLFRNVSNKKLLVYAGILLLFPVVIDALIVLSGYRLNLAAPAIDASVYFQQKAGITDDNFGIWLLEAETCRDVLKFNWQGSFIRMQEFIEGNRICKVGGLFLLGLYIGRNRIYANLEENMPLLKNIRFYGFLIALPLSVLYAWNAVHDRPFGMIPTAVLYAVSVFPLSFAYISAICLWYLKKKERLLFHVLAAPGRMALTNYIGQSVSGMFIFYGIGLGLGATIGLIYVEIIAAGVFFIQVAGSYVWLHYFQYGLLEWIWRMLTCGKWLKIMKQD